MRLFLDTEFNEYAGELISMALVTEDGREWYEVAEIPNLLGEWVAANVIPHLGKEPIGQLAFMQSLGNFIKDFDGCEIIADWPADFEHLCSVLSALGAQDDWSLPISCTMRLQHSGDLSPEIPHNALSDAQALREWWLRSSTAAAPVAA